MRISSLFLLFVPIRSSWSWVHYGSLLLCAAGEISWRLLLMLKVNMSTVGEEKQTIKNH
jgi:hypothetical protein